MVCCFHSSGRVHVAQVSAVGQHRSVPLEITPEARKRLTLFRERTFRAVYDAAMADGGGEVIESAQVFFYVSPYDEDQDSLALACWIDGTPEDARKVHSRISGRLSELYASWPEAERADYVRMMRFSTPILPERLRGASA